MADILKKYLILTFGITLLLLGWYLGRPFSEFEVEYLRSIGGFEGPIGVVLDHDENLWVVDASSNQISKLDSNGRIIFSFGKDRLRRPMDVAVDDQEKLYVVEFGADRVSVFGKDGMFLYSFGEKGKKRGQLDAPSGIAIDAEGHVYVAEFYNHRVQKFTSGGEALAVIGRPGRWKSGLLHYPIDIDFDSKGNLVVGDAYNNRVQIFNKGGKYLRKWGGPLGLGIPAPFAGWFYVTTGVFADQKERLYVADFYNSRIQVFTGSGSYLGSFGEGELFHPTDLVIDTGHVIYVADFGNKEIKVYKVQDDNKS